MGKQDSELSKVSPKEITIFIGGEDRRLVFGFKAAKILQERFGTLNKAMAGIGEFAENVDVAVDLLYALLAIDKTITREVVEGWADDLESIFEIVFKIREVLTSHAPVASDDPTAPTEK